MENVKGLLSAAVKHRALDERGPGFAPLKKEEKLGSALELIQRELASLGYYVVFGVLNAADYGVPQKRLRVFFIGSRDGEDIRLPKATHCDPSKAKSKGLTPWLTLRTALKGIEPKHWNRFTPNRLGLLTLLKAGQNWRDLPTRL